MLEKRKPTKGILVVGRLRGTENDNQYFDGNLTRDEALELLKEIESVHPGCYQINGCYYLDGSIDLQFISKHPHLNDLVFKFNPYSTIVAESIDVLERETESCDCSMMPNRHENIVVNHFTNEVFDKEGNLIGDVDVEETKKKGIVVVRQRVELPEFMR